jgi:hypothetical protein
MLARASIFSLLLIHFSQVNLLNGCLLSQYVYFANSTNYLLFSFFVFSLDRRRQAFLVFNSESFRLAYMHFSRRLKIIFRL